MYKRQIFETVISVETPNEKLLFPHDDENLDGLNFLEGKRVDEVNKMAELGSDTHVHILIERIEVGDELSLIHIC